MTENDYLYTVSNLASDIQYISGVGPKRAALIKAELGVSTMGELLRIYPYRYIDRSRFYRISEIAGEEAYVQIKARVVSRTMYGPSGSIISPGDKKLQYAVKRLSVIVEDSTGQMEMVFFKGIKWNYAKLVPDSVFVFFGKPSLFNGKLNMVHPEVDVPLPEGSDLQGGLTGVYPSTEKLINGGVTGKVMCKL